MKKILKNLCTVSVLATTTITSMVPCYARVKFKLPRPRITSNKENSPKRESLAPAGYENNVPDLLKKMMDITSKSKFRALLHGEIKEIPQPENIIEHYEMIKRLTSSMQDLNNFNTLYRSMAMVLSVYTTFISLQFDESKEVAEDLLNEFFDYLKSRTLANIEMGLKDKKDLQKTYQ